ncbi:MAG: hypothetical protein WDO24_06155 [Pseudomonadota bacterium]
MSPRGWVDLAAAKLGLDPVEIRRRNLIHDDAYPCTSPSGFAFEKLSHHQCLDKLVAMMDYDAFAPRAGGAARARRISRHRHRELHRADQSEPAALPASAARRSRHRTAAPIGSIPAARSPA